MAEADAAIEAGEPNAAVERLKDRLRNKPGSLLTRLALGRVLLAGEHPEQALAVLREAAALWPAAAVATLALGEALMALGHLPAAIAELQRAVRLDPTDAAQFALGSAWLEAGEIERASELLAKLAGSQPEWAARAAEKLAEAATLSRAGRSPPGYIRHLFDQFSGDYERRMLSELSYRAHLVLRELADLVVDGESGSLDILDLGCGTGLAGEAFKPLARRLDGVDLSPRMIEIARARGLYDTLTVADIDAYFAHGGRLYDLVVAADTLVYFGDLFAMFGGVRTRLQPNGCFLFTVEKHGEPGFTLGPKRRYRHSGEYIRATAERAGLECVGILDCSPRNEAGKPVEGLAVGLRRG